MDFNTLQNLQEAYQEVSQLMELTGGKGHPGYKAGSRDLGPMQSGHPADTFKRTMKGGTMSMRHGDHLGDLDDKDDDEGDLEAGLKDTARKKRENVRKPLRDKVRAARKRMTKEDYELDLFDYLLEYLVAEGYADTNKSALAIMANMSEEWKQSILNEDPVQDYRDMKRADENRAGMRGPEFSHDTAPGLKGKPQPRSATTKPQPRGREFTNPPS